MVGRNEDIMKRKRREGEGGLSNTYKIFLCGFRREFGASEEAILSSDSFVNACS